ncbi:hypothetical protein SLEP1_g59301 [Rubroshorea leprosula]|uniref:Uncharacterized protein n=1 Tax=Rubroshorea leprosula TaxID=152421 RepID=A0AAV5MRY1_9ROSI|nr:hypothetical protein SLEP1_g59301 [Rubroshorea leprosula]
MTKALSRAGLEPALSRWDFNLADRDFGNPVRHGVPTSGAL